MQNIVIVLPSLFVLTFPLASLAEEMCTTVENGYAFFDGKRNEWDPTGSVQIRKCGEKFELAYKDGKSTSSEKGLSSPTGDTKWMFDGTSCNEAGFKPGDRGRNKAILASGIKVREAWAVHPKTKKWERLPISQIVCHADEP